MTRCDAVRDGLQCSLEAGHEGDHWSSGLAWDQATAGGTAPLRARVPVELLDELDAWCGDQAVRPTRTAVVVEALRRFLRGDR